MRRLLLIGLVCASVHSSYLRDTRISQDLSVSEWSFSNATSSYPARVPGGIYTDLISAGVIQDDLYYRFNDFAYRWVSYQDWSYSTTFQVDNLVFAKQRILLVFDGLDTIASVYVNDILVGQSDNMFVQYKFDVKSVLLAGANTLRVDFRSPVAYAQEQWDIQSANYPVYPECVDPAFRGECHANHIRKMQASFSWDWGPAFPSMGIWKNVRLEGFDTLQVRDVMIFTDKSTSWNVRFVIHMDGAAQDTEFSGKVEIQVDELNIQESVTFYATTDGAGECSTEVTIPVTVEPELWWPNGYGAQKLYDATVGVRTNRDLVLRNLRFGFRTVELIQSAELVNNEGLSFFFKVNGLPVFLKGSNWIPSHVLPERSTPDKVRYLIKAAAEANQNSIRIWGGGIFESDEMYEAADEYGVLVWHDFMFACSMYPTTPAFLASVSAEIRHQVRRLQYHPSILIWAGNNENEVALRQNWYGTNSNFELYKADYKKLYVETMGPIVTSEDPSRPFTVSSPSNGLQSEAEDFVSEIPGSEYYGDIHYYNYFMDAWDPKNFPVPRMATEYGFQAMPSFRSIQKVTLSEDWSYNSTWNEHVQHHPGGNAEMLMQVAMHLPVPTNLDSEQGMKDMAYLTQVNQAMSIKAESEWYRRWMGKLDSTNRGFTYGAMYWQLQDIWPGHSWASIEYDGNWKLLHYYAKNFFSRVLPIPIIEDGALKVYVVSDLTGPINGAVQVAVQRYDAFQAGGVFAAEFLMPALSSELAAEWPLADLLSQSGCATQVEGDTSCFIRVSLSGAEAPSNFLILSEAKDASISKATLRVESITESLVVPAGYAKAFDIILTSDQVALFVKLEVSQALGHFSDNGFIMFTERKAIQFYSTVDISISELESQLSVYSLSDVS